jgi:peptidoglycan hydrolase-like protein with peptidoglycan-binding domain
MGIFRVALAAIASFACGVAAIALVAIAEGGFAFFPNRLGFELLTSTKISPPDLNVLPARDVTPAPLFPAVVTEPQAAAQIPFSDPRAATVGSREMDIGADDGIITLSSPSRDTTGAGSGTTQFASSDVHDEIRPWLSVGSSGSVVIDLQTLLNASRSEAECHAPEMECPLHLVVDGQFGPKTLARVQEFQRANALPPDGIVGPQTWKKLVAP